MSYGNSIYRHVYDLPIPAELLGRISREPGCRPDAVVKPAPCEPQMETQLVVDRLLRECFTYKPPGA